MAYQLFTLPKAVPLSTGTIMPGAKVSFFLTTTSTPTPVYTTSALSVAHTQPVVADSAGVLPAIYLDPTITYKATITSSADVLLYTIDPVNDQILSQTIIGNTLYPRTTDEVSASVTPTNYYIPPYDFRRYGISDDGVTDNTAAITTLLASFSAFSGTFYASPNVKFNFATVADALPARSILVDDSGINAWNTSGFRQKMVCIAAEGNDDSAVNDLQAGISSGHNACFFLDNRQSASSTSGQLGIAMVMWTNKRFTKEANQNGMRGLSRIEWSNLSSTDRWFYTLRRMVPWVAREYELWYSGKSYAAGSYIINGSVVYSTAAGGTAGASQPVHTTGSASDGGITWTVVIPNIDSSVFSVDQHGQIATNTSPTEGVVAYLKADRHSVGGTGQADVYVEADGISKHAALRLRPTDGSAAAVTNLPFFIAQDGVGVRLVSNGAVRSFFTATDTNLTLDNTRVVNVAAADIASAANAINTANKFEGKIIRDSTNRRLYTARGSGATDPWDLADGTAAVTPA